MFSVLWWWCGHPVYHMHLAQKVELRICVPGANIMFSFSPFPLRLQESYKVLGDVVGLRLQTETNNFCYLGAIY